MDKKNEELLPCPFCGDIPDFPRGDGTQYEIGCGACGGAMVSVQISDLMTIDERKFDPFTGYRYAEQFIDRAKARATELWNTRAAPVVSGEAWASWVSVEDRLPDSDRGIDVLVYRPGAHEMPANDPNVTIKRYSNRSGFSGAHEVTHWQPLPAAPGAALNPPAAAMGDTWGKWLNKQEQSE